MSSLQLGVQSSPCKPEPETSRDSPESEREVTLFPSALCDRARPDATGAHGLFQRSLRGSAAFVVLRTIDALDTVSPVQPRRRWWILGVKGKKS